MPCAGSMLSESASHDTEGSWYETTLGQTSRNNLSIGHNAHPQTGQGVSGVPTHASDLTTLRLHLSLFFTRSKGPKTSKFIPIFD